MVTALQEARSGLLEQNGDKAEQFLRSFQRAQGDLSKITSAGILQAERAVRELRNELIARIASLTGSLDDPFTISLAPAALREIQGAVDQFSRITGQNLQASMAGAFDLGSAVSANALNGIGIPIPFAPVTPELLVSLGAEAGGIISEASADLIARISRELRLSAAGLEPTSAAIARIQNILQISREVRRGLRRRTKFAFQAESIVRTEVGRIYSTAQQAATERIATIIPDLRKRWITTLRKRRGHLAAEERYAPDGEIGPILIRERFEVTEFSRSDFNRSGFWTFQTRGGAQRVIKGNPGSRRGRPVTDRMLHPRDASASAGNVTNCSCLIFETLEEIERATDRALGILQSGDS